MPLSPSQTTSPDTSTSTFPPNGGTAGLNHRPPNVRQISSSTVDNERRPSVQFDIEQSRNELALRRAGSVKSQGGTGTTATKSKRLPSPPPPSAYHRGVSFDTFNSRDATDYSLTLNYKHKDYTATRRSRTFLCGTDQNDYSDFALEWLIDELVDDGDEIVCLRAVEKDSKIASDSSVEEGRYRQEAEKLLAQVIEKNKHDEKAISLVMELAIGKVQEIIQRMIQIYEPAVLIVGTRGRSLGGMQGLLPGSVSKYCLQQSPIPVIVVRPSTKREKKKKKRQANPSRRSYNHILEASGSHVFDSAGSTNSSATKLPADEAAAVAKAVGVGLQPSPMEHAVNNLSLSREASPIGKSSDDNDNDNDNDEADGRPTSSGTSDGKRRRSSDFPAVLTSPTLGDDLESPAISDEEDEGNDSGDEMDDEEQEAVSPPVNKKEDGTYTAG
ncbi:hypothetical protein FQN54_002890 [Arachnomyces sp. PD_36]|nr:hypothetical protein FQN54_002890 [Arachnomyces sp. PD_36]